MQLNRDFYLQNDVVALAKQLLGKLLFTRIDKVVCSGIITETEAYAGIIVCNSNTINKILVFNQIGRKTIKYLI